MDPLIVWCSKRNNGVYEPEFRLIPVIFGLMGGAGLFAYAYVVDVKGNMYLASFLWGLTLFGIIFVLTPANSYVIDVSRAYKSPSAARASDHAPDSILARVLMPFTGIPRTE